MPPEDAPSNSNTSHYGTEHEMDAVHSDNLKSSQAGTAISPVQFIGTGQRVFGF